MAWVIAVLGAVLAAGGSAALWNGYAYTRLDWGQVETVAGTVALSSGVVTIAIAAVLFALRDLARRPARAAPSGVGSKTPHLADEAEAPAPTRSGLAGRLARVGMPKPELTPPEPADPRPVPDPVLLPAEAEPAYDPRPRAAPVAVPEAPRSTAAVPAEAPTVVGRYEANGASYVLFSDGTIEVETDSGTHRFASMADLKEHIERQDAG